MAKVINYSGRSSIDDHEGGANFHKQLAEHHRAAGDERLAKKHDEIVTKNLKRAERVSKKKTVEHTKAAKESKQSEKVAQMTGDQQAADYHARAASAHGAIAVHHAVRAEKLAEGKTRFDAGGMDEYARDEIGRFTSK